MGEKARDIVFWVGLVVWGTVMMVGSQYLARVVAMSLVFGTLVLGMGPCPGPPPNTERLQMAFPRGGCDGGRLRVQLMGTDGAYYDVNTLPLLEPGEDCLAGWPAEDAVGFAKGLRVCCVLDEWDARRGDENCSEAPFVPGAFEQPAHEEGQVVVSDGQWLYTARGECAGKVYGQGGQDLTGS